MTLYLTRLANMPKSVELAIPSEAYPAYKIWHDVLEQIDTFVVRAQNALTKKSAKLAQIVADQLKELDLEVNAQWRQFKCKLEDSDFDITSLKRSHLKAVDRCWEYTEKLIDLVDVNSATHQLNQPASNVTVSGNGSNPTPTFTPRLEIPPLKIPEFHGSLEDWPAFWEGFKTLIHDNASLPDIIKFTYLRGALKGDALKIVQGFEVNEANYTEVIKLLNEKFEDKDKRKRLLVHELMDISIHNHNLKELSRFYDNTCRILRCLKSLVNVDEADWFLKEMILRKLPADSQNFLFGHYKTTYLTTNQIISGLAKLIEILEAGPKVNEKVVKPKNNYVPQTENDKSRLVIQSNTVLTCLLCSENHRTSHCPTYLGNDKRARIIQLKICLKCAQSFGPQHKCTRTFVCHKCKGGHRTDLCLLVKNGTQATSSPPQNSTPNQATSTVAANGRGVKQKNDPQQHQVKKIEAKGSGVALATAQIKVSYRGRHTTCRSFFDIGSQMSFVHPKLLQKLGIEYEPDCSLTVSPFVVNDTDTSASIEGQYVKLGISLGKRKFNLRFFATPQTQMVAHCPGLSQSVKTLLREGHRMADPQVGDTIQDVELIVGADYLGKLVGQVKRLSGINVLTTPGGYVVFGKMPFVGKMKSTALKSIQMNRLALNPTVETQVESPPVHKLWDLDCIGITKSSIATVDEAIVKDFNESIVKTPEKYLVDLPFSRDPEALPTNYHVAFKQLQLLLARLRKDPDSLNCYHQIIQDYLSKGFIEQVSGPVRGHYLPHHAVRKDSSTTPIRIVFNASSASGGNSSLNDYLETGPSLTEKLLDCLINFREGRFALCSDISKAFLRVGLKDRNRDYVRFLWVEDPKTSTPKYVTYRFASVPFGTTSSPFLLQATLQYHFDNTTLAEKDLLKRSFYVDNFCTTLDDASSLIPLYEVATKCLAEANMPLQEWNSNNVDFVEWLADEQRKPKVSMLGVDWHVSSDFITIKDVPTPPFEKVTRRSALSFISECFDPLGLVSPVTVRGRVIMRELWKKRELGWDDKIDTVWVGEIQKLAKCYAKVSTIQFPRMSCNLSDPITLHMFCDASGTAYGAVAYVVQNNVSNLLMSKVRVSPLREKTIPQLELTAILIGCRLIDHLKKVLRCNIDNIFLWTDNLPCISWIENQNSSIIYVRNRVSEINDLKEEHKIHIHHVGTHDNPADLPSRGCTVNKLNTDMWLHGPTWLTNVNEWPSRTLKLPDVTMHELVTDRLETSPLNHSVVDIHKFSSYYKLISVTKYVLDFIKKIIPSFTSNLTPEIYWIRRVQQEVYPNVLVCLKTGTKEPRYQASLKFIRDLNLYLDENEVIRSKGRYGTKQEFWALNNVVLLPPKHHFSMLIMNKIHVENAHAGANQTLATLKKEFWIPQGKPRAKKVVRDCFTCTIVKGLTYKYPMGAPLPSCRVSYARPFEVTGVDFTAAISLKDPQGSIVKYYICLFTCTATRAIHLEVCTSLSAECFINCLRRFIAKCSVPNCLISDNGTNFKATSKFISTLYNNCEVESYLRKNKILWKFNTPRCAWQGGFFERLIGIVKDCLLKATFKRSINYEELVTIIAEIESIINSRPLVSYVGGTDTEEEILTPAHLLYGRSLQRFPKIIDNDNYKDIVDNADVLLDYYKRISSAIQKFHRLWETQYINSLREKHFTLAQKVQPPKLGELVYIKEKRNPQNYPLGKVVELLEGKDSQIREVKVLINGDVWRKPVSVLIPLEVSNLHNDVTVGNAETDSEEVIDNPTIPEANVLPRTQRAAARRCREERLQLIARGDL